MSKIGDWLDKLCREQEEKMYENKLWAINEDKATILKLEKEKHGENAREIIFHGETKFGRSLLKFDISEYNTWEYKENN